MPTGIAGKVAELVRGPIEGLGLSLWDVRYLKEGASWYLRIYIDSENGINIDNCTDVSHLIDPILDEADLIRDQYYLEVCSPGLSRELREENHFLKYIGKGVIVKTVRAKDGVKEFKGILECYDGSVTIISDEKQICFEKGEISKVLLDDIDF